MRRMKWWLAAVAVGVGGSPAAAFYWPGWPSSPPARIDRSVLPPGQNPPGTPVADPKFPNIDQGFPTPPPPPEHVPEPATGVAGLIGLGVLAVAKWRRKKS